MVVSERPPASPAIIPSASSHPHDRTAGPAASTISGGKPVSVKTGAEVWFEAIRNNNSGVRPAVDVKARRAHRKLNTIQDHGVRVDSGRRGRLRDKRERTLAAAAIHGAYGVIVVDAARQRSACRAHHGRQADQRSRQSSNLPGWSGKRNAQLNNRRAVAASDLGFP